MERLYKELLSYGKEDYYPMHMPGHKRNTNLMQMINPYEIDITEVEGFDNLHQPEGILLKQADRLRSLYGAGKSYPLINGSTAGLLAGISALTYRGSKVLLARNCHKAVYHALVLKGLVPIYCYPQHIEEFSVNGGILVSDIEEALIKNVGIQLVVITSPSYEGIVSDIKAIADVVHSYGAFLLVDEAHGAHFGYHKGFPQSAVGLGADIVIQSLHKTLPAFTQTAVLHSNVPHLNGKIEKYLTIYQSSSPSYLLMSGIDQCISILEDQGEALFNNYYKELTFFYKEARKLRNLKIFEPKLKEQYGIYDVDLSKITISVQNTQINGHDLQRILQDKYHIVMEMATPDYVIAMTSICDTKDGFVRLLKALFEIDGECVTIPKEEERYSLSIPKPSQVMLPGEVLEAFRTKPMLLEKSVGFVAAAFITMYPPGSPLLVPGEKIDDEVLNYIKWIKQNKITITGLCSGDAERIEVVWDT